APQPLVLSIAPDLPFCDFTQRLVKMGLAQSMGYLRTRGPWPSQVSAANAAHRSDWFPHNVGTVTSLSAPVQWHFGAIRSPGCRNDGRIILAAVHPHHRHFQTACRRN